MQRRTYLRGTGAASVFALGGLAGCLDEVGGGDEYPSEDIRSIVPYSAGGGTDDRVRPIVEVMSDETDVDVFVENHPGGETIVGLNELVDSEPTGHDFISFNLPTTVIAMYTADPEFVDHEDFIGAGVGTYATESKTFISNPDEDVNGLDDMIDRYAEGEFENIAAQSPGTTDHAIIEVTRDLWGFDWQEHIGYDSSGEIIQSVASGEAPCGIATDNVVTQAADAGNVDVVAVGSSEGSLVMPDEETVVDYGFEEVDYLTQLTRTFWTVPETPEENRDALAEIVESAVSELAPDDEGLQYQPPEQQEETYQTTVDRIPEEVDLEMLQ